MEASNALKAELQQAESILNTQYSFDLAEPCYLRSLEIIERAPGERAVIIDLLEGTLIRGEISEEPMACSSLAGNP